MKFHIRLKQTWVIEWNPREHAYAAIPPLNDAARPFHFADRESAVDWVGQWGNHWMDNWRNNRGQAKATHASMARSWATVARRHDGHPT